MSASSKVNRSVATRSRPVATVAVDGARNAGLLAARILALQDAALADRIAAGLEAERAKYSATAPPA